MKAKKTARKREKKRQQQPMVTVPGARQPRAALRWPYLVCALPVLAVALLVFAGAKLQRHFTHAAQFELVALEVDGLRLLSGDDVLKASGLQVGDNVLAIDLHDVARRVQDMPWVKRAIVVRKPPDRLVVELVERQRVAWLKLEETYGIDAEGVLLPGQRLAKESYGDIDLPIISGVSCDVDSLYPGLALVDSVQALRTILDWWQRAVEVAPEFCTGISEISTLEDEGISLRMAGDGLEVRLPVDQVAVRLRALKRMMPRIYREYPDPAYIDLRYTGQLIVGSKEADSG